jgi:hypothetical protein
VKTFDKPVNLNGAELRNELRIAGVAISDDPAAVQEDGNGKLVLDIKTEDESKAAIVVKAHNGTIAIPELTINDKLAQVGLNIDDLKAAMGL